MKLHRGICALLLFASAACTDALADVPTMMGTQDALRYTRIGEWLKGHAVSVTTTGTCIAKSTTGYSAGDESTCKLFVWGTPVSLHADAQAVCACATMDEDVTIYTGTSCGRVDDPNATVPDTTENNECRYIPAGGRHDFWVGHSHWGGAALSSTSPSGYRDKACIAPATLVGNPCDADDDCPTGGAGACGTSTGPGDIKGLYIMVIGTASTMGWSEDI